MATQAVFDNIEGLLWPTAEDECNVLTDMHMTALSSVVVTADWFKKIFSLPQNGLNFVDTISTGAQGLKLASRTISTLPSIFKLVSLTYDLTTLFRSSEGDINEWTTIEKVNEMAKIVFAGLGDVSHITIALHTFHFIKIAHAIPILQLIEASVFGVIGIHKIREAWDDETIMFHDKFLTIAKEISNLSIGVLGLVSLWTSAAPLALATLTLSTIWIGLDLTQYAHRDDF